MVRSILIVDDSPTVRQAFCEIFNREKDFDVCGEAANGQDAIDACYFDKQSFFVFHLTNR
jgi:chemotaxis response regulator CheB